MVFWDGHVRNLDVKGSILRILVLHGDRQGRERWDTKPTRDYHQRRHLESDEGLLDIKAIRQAIDTGCD